MTIEKSIFQVRVRLVTPMLGTVPKNKLVYTEHVAAKALKEAEKLGLTADGSEATPKTLYEKLEEEAATVENIEEKGWTGRKAA